MTADLLLDCRHQLAEGPVWHDNALWWVNINAGELHRLDPATGNHRHRAVGGLLGCAVPTDHGRWLLARNGGLDFLDFESGVLEPICAPEGDRLRHRFNDGKCDPGGRFFTGTINLDGQPEAAFYRMDADLRPVRLLQGVTVSNGLAWSPDGGTFYYADSPTRRVDCFDWDPKTGNISRRRPLVVIPEGSGVPDGMDIDSNGNLWVALWGGAAVVCYHGRTGAELDRILLPVSHVSSCVFGCPDLATLFITTAWQDLGMEALASQPAAGSIFQIRPGVSGHPVSRFLNTPNP
jgi:sugar lactone lactonase YvrE